MMPTAPYRILIVDNDRILRHGLRVLLASRPDFRVVGEADGASALIATTRLKPNVVLLDLWLPQAEDGLRILDELRATARDTHIIITASHSATADLVHRAIRAGAVGYLTTMSSDISEVELAIRTVAEGQAYFSPDALAKLVDAVTSGGDLVASEEPDVPDELSAREQDVLDLVALGCTNRQIADRLIISESTVRSHLHRILDKLQLTNRVQAAAFALRSRSAVTNSSGRGAVDARQPGAERIATGRSPDPLGLRHGLPADGSPPPGARRNRPYEP